MEDGVCCILSVDVSSLPPFSLSLFLFVSPLTDSGIWLHARVGGMLEGRISVGQALRGDREVERI